MKRLRPTRFPRRKPTRRVLMAIYRALVSHYGPRHWWPGKTPFEVIVGAILTQNTAWKNVEKAIQNLKKEEVLTPERLHGVPRERLANLIRPAGYFNVKAERLKSFLDYLHEQFGGSLDKMFQVPLLELREELLSVKGIGEETADSILLYAGGKRTFVVDAYTRRIFTRHRYLKGDEDYGMIRSLFMRLLPKSALLYNDYHAQIVEAGKDSCRKIPRCDACPLRKYL